MRQVSSTADRAMTPDAEVRTKQRCLGPLDSRLTREGGQERTSMGFDLERTFATGFFGALSRDSDLRGEIVAAMTECLSRYDTGPWENRFIVGGVFEQILGSAARELGLHVQNAGARLQGYDLELADDRGISVKFASGRVQRSARFRLTNSQGAAGAWRRGTLFVQTGLGIGYADPDLAPGITTTSGDGKSLDIYLLPLLGLWGVEAPPARPATSLPPQAQVTFAPDPRYFLHLPIPERPKIRAPRLASDPIARDVLSSGKTERLRRAYRDAI